MPTKLLCIESIDKLVLSASTATSGTHFSLDYIPGSALLGAVAARLYKELDAKAQWAVFHSGQLRFGNAYPATETNQTPDAENQSEQNPSLASQSLTRQFTPAWPMPLSLHVAKNTAAFDNDHVLSQQVIDLSAPLPDNGKPDTQVKQVRSHYLNHQRKQAKTNSDYQLKTAIDYQTGAANSGQLYGYNTLAADQMFIGELSWDEAFERDYPDALTNVLDVLQNQSLRLGRAKSAEFGRVKIQCRDKSSVLQKNDELLNDGAKEITLFCISDLALKDDSGQATLQLTPKHLGLEAEQVQLIPERCFIRTSQYAVYNAARHSYDQQRAVIAKGSVFVFKALADVNNINQTLAKSLAKGVGLFTEAGLGQLSTRLYIPEPAGSDGFSSASTSLSASDVQNSTLISWLTTRAGSNKQQQDANKQAMHLLVALRKRYKQSRLLAAIPSADPWGPNKHNWAEVLTLAKEAHNNNVLMDKLFNGDAPPVRLTALTNKDKDYEKFKDGDNWQVLSLDNNGAYISMAQWLHQELQNMAAPAEDKPEVSLHMVMQILSRQAMSENMGREA